MNDNFNNQTVLNSPNQSEQSSSKDIHQQYKDYSGVDTESFIIETLRENPKDRGLLLSLEKFFREFIEDGQQMTYQFQAMNSYERMIVHRVAAFFGLHHHTDKNGQCVVISKTSNMRIPDLSFRTIIENQSIETKSSNEQRKIPTRPSNQKKFLSSSSQLNQPIVPINPIAMPNYLPMIPTNGSAYYGAHGIPLTPIFFHPTANGPIQYLYPTVVSQPIDRSLTPIYRSDLLPPRHFVPFQYPTNQFAALTLQSPIRSMSTMAHPPPPLPARNYLGRPFVQYSTITKKSSRPTTSSDKSKSD